MTTLQKPSRTSFVRQRRTLRPTQGSASQPAQGSAPKAKPAQLTTKTARQTYRTASVYLPVEPKLAPRPSVRKVPASRGGTRMTKNSRGNNYDIVFSLGRTNVHAPALTIPQLGPRWVSAALTMVLCFLLLTMWTAAPFTVAAAEVRGNQRLGAEEVNKVLGMSGEPIFKAVPAQLETDLRTTYSDLKSVSVHVSLPNHITVDVVERTPVLAWYQNGVVTWIDSNGVAFAPRGDDPGLLAISANGAPIQIPPDPALSIYEQKFITPEMIKALSTLAPIIPAGMPMIYDPRYGMGWQDPRGWTVYFGQNTNDIPMKLLVYQAIADTLTLQGIQPTLISVEYVNAPFYK
jgi:cell division protein FtsQ